MSAFHGLSLGKTVQADEPGVGVAVGGIGVNVGVGVAVAGAGVGVGVAVGTCVGVLVAVGIGVLVAVEIGGGVTVGLRLPRALPGSVNWTSETSASTPKADTRDLIFMCRLPSNFDIAGGRPSCVP